MFISDSTLQRLPRFVRLLLLLACTGAIIIATTSVSDFPTSAAASTADKPTVPLTDLGTGHYLGFEGGLYPGGSNVMPAQHMAAGAARAGQVRPLDVAGNPSADGRYILLSIGMSNTTQEFCGSNGDGVTCNPWTFMGQASQDAAVNHSSLVMLNGAKGGQDAPTWDQPTDANYDRIRDTILTPQGLSEQQVQIIWLKLADAHPTVALPASDADAYALLASLANVVRALKMRYPQLQQVFISNRTYAGYATSDLNPEPYAYETGFAVKWLIEAQIEQMAQGGQTINPLVGDLNDTSSAPWLAWGPDLWANGLTPRSDGLIWERADFERDGTHPSRSGETKVANLLLAFFKTSSHTRCWFLADETCSSSTSLFLPYLQR